MLEQEGCVQHIRVSNHKDLVPVVPPLPDFEHVGLNLYLNPDSEKGYELDYRGNRSMFGQWSLNLLDRHSLVDYWDRKTALKDQLGDKKLPEIYSDDSVTRGFQDPTDK